MYWPDINLPPINLWTVPRQRVTGSAARAKGQRSIHYRNARQSRDTMLKILRTR